MNFWKRSFDGAAGAGAGAGTGPGAGDPMAGLPRRTRGIVAGEGRSGERRQKKRGRIFLAFQTDWLNRWVRDFRIVKAGQLVNYSWPSKGGMLSVLE